MPHRLLFSALCLSLCLSSLVLLVGCGGSTRVERVDTNTDIDLSGGWTDGDSRRVAEHMVADAFKFPWLAEFTSKHGRKPVIRLDRVVARSDGEVISTDIFLNDIRRAFIQSGKVTVVSSRDESDVTRSELRDQDVHASEETRKEAFQETGADFILHGAINTQNDQEGRRQVRFYSTDLFLTEVQTRVQVWPGNYKIKKDVTQASFR